MAGCSRMKKKKKEIGQNINGYRKLQKVCGKEIICCEIKANKFNGFIYEFLKCAP